MNTKLADLESSSSAIEAFAVACEQLNDFGRTLQQTNEFSFVRTGANIRNYRSGWRLEKWVEAELIKGSEYWACWWLELGVQNETWLVQANLSISHDAFFFELPTKYADSLDNLKTTLDEAIGDLTKSLRENVEFYTAVNTHRQRL